WSSTARQPRVPVRLPRWSPVEMVSVCTGRRGFLRSSTSKGLPVPPRWKPSHPHAHIQVSHNTAHTALPFR
ncbi:unnamed protein product, partial [Bubo scandiacus]